MKTLVPMLVVTLLSCHAATAAAQSRFASPTTEAGVTYSFLRDDGENAQVGMVFDISRRLKGPLYVIGEAGINRFTDFDQNMSQFGGGLRLSPMSMRRVRPFVQTVVGAQRFDGSAGLNVQPGGGAHIGLTRRLDARVQVDFPFARWEGETYRQFRFSAGVGVPFGRGGVRGIND